MKIRSLFILGFLLFATALIAQDYRVDQQKVRSGLNELLTDLANRYVYLEEKGIDLDCIREKYSQKIEQIQSEEEIVLFFEYILDEFYDNHLILNTNRTQSYRLYSTIYAETKNGKSIITQVWQSQLQNLDVNIIGAEILKMNGMDFAQVIDQFPTLCQDKNQEDVRNWITNKVLAGRYSEPRRLSLRLATGQNYELDLGLLKLKTYDGPLNIELKEGIGIVRLNNSLGNASLIQAFDQALDQMTDTRGLVIDLRNTVDGGNSYIARAIMGRFIEKDQPYQKHRYVEDYGNHDPVVRSWVEYVSPRGETYKKPVVVLVGRWTGSMGEGLAIGFEGMGRAEILGTEMERLAGSMQGFSFKYFGFGYRLSTEKLFHVNGTPREKYVPTHYFSPDDIVGDQMLDKALELIKKGK